MSQKQVKAARKESKKAKKIAEKEVPEVLKIYVSDGVKSADVFGGVPSSQVKS